LNCNEREFKKIEPTKRGKLLTYTIVNELPWGIDERGRVIGVVEFDNGLRAMGLIRADKVKLGMKLTTGWDEVRYQDGETLYGLIFEG
jgi:uncharacterized OB-fold protein